MNNVSPLVVPGGFRIPKGLPKGGGKPGDRSNPEPPKKTDPPPPQKTDLPKTDPPKTDPPKMTERPQTSNRKVCSKRKRGAGDKNGKSSY